MELFLEKFLHFRKTLQFSLKLSKHVFWKFLVKQRTTRNVQFLFFRSFLLVLKNFSFWEKDAKILSLKLFGNSWGDWCIPYLLLIITLRFTCCVRKFWPNIKNSQNAMTMIVCKNFLLIFVSLLTAPIVKTVIFWLEFTPSF